MIIIAQRIGQLGNRLVLFAHLIAFAQEHHLTVINLAFDEYAPLFQSTRSDLLCRYPPAPFPLKPTPMRRRLLFRLAARVMRGAKKRLPFVHVQHLDDDERFELDANFAEIARHNIVLIGGYFFRMPGGFPESADTLRAYFQPMPSVQSSVQQVTRSARAGHDILIGVHLRQGDYREYENGRYFYTTSQYIALMSKVVALFAPRRAAFLVCSNEPQKAGAFAGFPVTFGTGDLAEDLYGLTACDYLIGPPSTFTVWASFYGSVPLCRVFDPSVELRLEDFQLAQEQGWLY